MRQDREAAVSASIIAERMEIGAPEECWPWRGSFATNGYGRYGKPGRYAHRLVYETFVGEIPDGLNVCHHCDNPPCCNPAHLFLGTQKDNAQDMARKGRVGGGPRPRFNWEQARELHAQGLGFREIGRRLGVCHSSVSAAVRRAA